MFGLTEMEPDQSTWYTVWLCVCVRLREEVENDQIDHKQGTRM